MNLQCPKCKQLIDISSTPQQSFQCPHCNETIDISRLEESTCPICCSEFSVGDSLVICPDCKTIYHSECWDENHGCSTYGCASTKHLETHNAASGDADAGMVKCPFCGESHAATDLICPSCGHVLQENAAGNDDILQSVKNGAQKFLPQLGRNFKLLGEDVKTVLALAWKAMTHYADFKGRTTRSEYGAFLIVFCATIRLTADSGLALIVFLVCLVPIFSITVRRLRDTGLSPWMIFAIPILPLLVLVPTVKE